jgi:hypothetical protein
MIQANEEQHSVYHQDHLGFARVALTPAPSTFNIEDENFHQLNIAVVIQASVSVDKLSGNNEKSSRYA